jgi:hypothetical protein
VKKWIAVDKDYSVGEFRVKLLGWQTERRFAVVCEVVRESRDSVGRKLIDVPGYVFRIFVTHRDDSAEQIWRDYNQRFRHGEPDRAELRHDPGADRFCRRSSSLPRRRSGPSYCYSIYCRSSSRLQDCRAIVSRLRRGLRFLLAAQSWDVVDGVWCFICPRAGVV